MEFDLCEHRVRSLIVRCGKLFWPEEQNVTILYEGMCKKLGIPVAMGSSRKSNHLPTPAESARHNPESPLIQICPNCGKRSYVPSSICQSCKDSENGKYKAMFECFECKHKEKFDKWLVQVLNEKGIEIPSGMKRSLGIKTMTDGGLE